MTVGKPNNPTRPGAAFTLIELIVVMLMMVIIMGIVSPQLKGFFTGRDLDSESHRILSLTRLGRTRAVSEGLPVDLWFDVKQGRYGLGAEGGYAETYTNPVVYKAAESVEIMVGPALGGLLTQSNVWTMPATKARSLPAIRFQPDGVISDSSPLSIRLRQGQGSEIWLVKNTNHLRYDIETGHTSAKR